MRRNRCSDRLCRSPRATWPEAAFSRRDPRPLSGSFRPGLALCVRRPRAAPHRPRGRGPVRAGRCPCRPLRRTKVGGRVCGSHGRLGPAGGASASLPRGRGARGGGPQLPAPDGGAQPGRKPPHVAGVSTAVEGRDGRSQHLRDLLKIVHREGGGIRSQPRPGPRPARSLHVARQDRAERKAAPFLL